MTEVRKNWLFWSKENFIWIREKICKFKKKGKVKGKEIEKRTEAQFNVLIILVVLG